MPYIKQNKRKELEEVFGRKPMNIGFLCNNPGELNYLISNIILGYLDKKGESYSTFNELMGVLECVKQEFYRRSVADYEEEKMKINGDIF